MTLPFFSFDDCSGISFGTLRPVDAVDPNVPDDFGPASSVPFLAQLGVEAFQCSKVVYRNRTFENVGLLWSSVNVVPDESEWGKGGDSYYTFDVLTTNESLAQGLAELQIPAVVATLRRDEVSAPGGGTEESWDFSNSNLGFKFSYARGSEGQPSVRKFNRYHWLGEGPYSRIDIYHEDRMYQPGVQGGTLELTGDSNYEKALGSDRTPIQAAALQSVEWILQSNNQTFGR